MRYVLNYIFSRFLDNQTMVTDLPASLFYLDVNFHVILYANYLGLVTVAK